MSPTKRKHKRTRVATDGSHDEATESEDMVSTFSKSFAQRFILAHNTTATPSRLRKLSNTLVIESTRRQLRT